jgi:aryl-alcohol dehydrogenase-like predicted oxidoreductase
MQRSLVLAAVAWLAPFCPVLGAETPNVPDPASPLHAPHAVLAEAEWQAIQTTIGDQLAALRDGDAPRAFSFASAGIREQFSDADTFINGGYKALLEMREQGLIKAFGAGINEWENCQWLLERGDFDMFLLAGRYTLLEQLSLDTFLPMAQARGVGIVNGGAYNSGILATGPRPGAFYNYDPAPQDILDKAGAIQAICQKHNVRLVDAAFQFALRHPAVVSVIPGGQSQMEAESNLKAAQAEIPPELWADLKTAGLLRQDAPV